MNAYKYLFNYVNNQNLSEQINENEVEDELIEDDDIVSEEEDEVRYIFKKKLKKK